MKKIRILLVALLVISVGFLSGCNEQTAIEQENKLPTASCSANPTEGVAPLTVNFVGSGSDSDGIITSYYWDFDDGESSMEQNPNHTFQSSGVYTVTLTVKDDKGAGRTATVEITVTEPPSNQIPTCSLDVNTNSGDAPFTVTFYLTANDDDGKISFWELDINNDGAAEYSDSGEPPSSKQHTYSDSGTFTAVLTVVDNGSATTSDSVTITVSAPPPVKILSHSSYYHSGYFYVVGEVQNFGNNNIEFVKIVATFYNSAD
jgi:PKD repeat protein